MAAVKSFNWKIFTVLLIASFVAYLLVIPYTLALSHFYASVFTPILFIVQSIQYIILFAITISVGLYLAARVGFRLPLIEKLIHNKDAFTYFKSILGTSVGLGLLAGLLIIVSSFLFSTNLSTADVSIPLWKSFLASFYGGIDEEILFRLFLMTLIVWILFKIKKTSDGKPTTIGIWIAIVVSALAFGYGHLPVTGTITTITPLIIIRALLLNGIAGIIFGWLYWKKGLESAMISHFSADILLHVMFPLILVVL